jgi:hypothetical protein
MPDGTSDGGKMRDHLSDWRVNAPEERTHATELQLLIKQNKCSEIKVYRVTSDCATFASIAL